MSKTYRKERTKPKTTKPTQKNKYKGFEEDYELEQDYDWSMKNSGEIDEDELDSSSQGFCFCEEIDIEHCGKCYTIVDGELVHRDGTVDSPEYFKDVTL